MPKLFRVRLQRADALQGNTLQRRLRRLSAMEQKEEARAFLDMYHDATGAGRATRQARWAEVRRQLRHANHYDHTPDELAYGARLAWRNNGRCIGRLMWESLDVVDCRHITAVEHIAERVFDHLDEGHGDGRIRSVLSVFPPVKGNALPAWIESPQAVQYAAYAQPDGRVIGDRQNLEATRIAASLGWVAPDPRGRFDPLPLLIRDQADRRHMFQIPPVHIREIDIIHPHFPALAALGLKWYSGGRMPMSAE